LIGNKFSSKGSDISSIRGVKIVRGNADAGSEIGSSYTLNPTQLALIQKHVKDIVAQKFKEDAEMSESQRSALEDSAFEQALNDMDFSSDGSMIITKPM
jgi:hypothetical protein